MDADRAPAGYQLTDELARLCLPAANWDPNRNLAWINSVCILFLLVGIAGAKPARISVPDVPPLDQAVPAIVEPAPPPPQVITADSRRQNENNQQPDAPSVVLVTPDSPDINFSVPTIGTLVVPNAIAGAPPLQPLRAPVAISRRDSLPASLNSTGAGGERPQPPYPRIALEQAEQGTVTLSLTADEGGNVLSVEVKQTSGYPILDRSTVDYVRRHWRLPSGTGVRRFETSITYRLRVG
jgi:periplasmic protein TonB